MFKWHRREDDLDELFRNPDWRKAREETIDSQKIAESVRGQPLPALRAELLLWPG